MKTGDLVIIKDELFDEISSDDRNILEFQRYPIYRIADVRPIGRLTIESLDKTFQKDIHMDWLRPAKAVEAAAYRKGLL